jgi:DNA replication protein DnaC
MERVTLAGLVDSTVPPAIPQIFLDTDVTRLHPKIQTALDWKPQGDVSGLLLHGTTGVGKTRGIWEIIKRLWAEETKKDKQLKFEFLTMRKLETTIESGFKEQKHGTAIDYLINCPLLILDDFGKERLTQRMASDLFAIVDERSTSRRATIISTNFNGSTLLDRFDNRDKETGVALIRRLKDYYRAVGVG